VVVHNSAAPAGLLAAELVAGMMCGVRNWGSDSVAELVEGFVVLWEVGNSVAALEV